MKFHKKKIFCAIMALMACVLIVAAPNKVKAEHISPNISLNARIYSDGVTPGISCNTYYYKGYACSSSGIDHIEIRLFKFVNGRHEFYRSGSINCNNTCRVDLSRNQELSHILSSNPEGHYVALLTVYDNDGHWSENEQYHYITKSLGSYMAGLYKYILGRDPEMEGYANHINGLWNGASRESVINVFLNSDEFQYRVIPEYGLR